jgi:hypothetical protein
MALPLLICGIQSVLIGYAEGACQDYDQFLLADEGTKNERTFLASSAYASALNILQAAASARQDSGRKPPRCFQREGVLYVPAEQK